MKLYTIELKRQTPHPMTGRTLTESVISYRSRGKAEREAKKYRGGVYQPTGRIIEKSF